MNRMAHSLILASASPRRRELMACTGLPFQVITADAEEMKTKHEADKKCRGEILSEIRKRLVERGVVSKREQV